MGAKRAEVQIAYAIGVKDPVSIHVNTFGTGKVEESILENAIKELFDLTPKGIIKKLDLIKPIYSGTSCYGHFGRKGFTWEKTDMVDKLKKLVWNQK